MRWLDTFLGPPSDPGTLFAFKFVGGRMTTWTKVRFTAFIVGWVFAMRVNGGPWPWRAAAQCVRNVWVMTRTAT